MNSPKKHEDHSFSAFAMGATIGVVTALLLGTDEGRKLLKKILDTIPEKYKKIPEGLVPRSEPEVPLVPIITPLETPHHTTFEPEAPPPPPPAIRPLRPQ
jgi:hypothetical protein